MDEQEIDKMSKYLALNVAFAVAGFMALVATIALFGPKLAPLMNKLPW